jgi:CRP-like cAMP-binding protein
VTTAQNLQQIIAEFPMFHNLEPRFLELITGCASNVRFNEGDLIFREGEQADHFYAIRHGTVAIEVFVPQRGSVNIQTVSAGDVLNWSWLIPPHRNQFDARCLSLVRALAFDGACLRGKCEEDHSLGYELMKRFAEIMAERVRATRLQLLDVYGDTDSG